MMAMKTAAALARTRRMLASKKGQEGWLGIFISILFFAAVSILCVFIVWFLTHSTANTTSSAVIATEHSLAADILVAEFQAQQTQQTQTAAANQPDQPQANQIWRIVDQQSVNPSTDQPLIDNTLLSLKKIKTICLTVKSKDYAAGTETQLFSTSTTSAATCKTAHAFALPQSFAIIGLEVPQ